MEVATGPTAAGAFDATGTTAAAGAIKVAARTAGAIIAGGSARALTTGATRPAGIATRTPAARVNGRTRTRALWGGPRSAATVRAIAATRTGSAAGMPATRLTGMSAAAMFTTAGTPAFATTVLRGGQAGNKQGGKPDQDNALHRSSLMTG